MKQSSEDREPERNGPEEESPHSGEYLWGFDDESIHYRSADGRTLTLQDEPELYEQVVALCRERAGAPAPAKAPARQRRRRGFEKPPERPVPAVKAEVFNQDCISGMHERLADGSVHLVICSPPFEELFTYSGKREDVGNNGSTIDVRAGRFALNLRFWIEQLYRVTAPGCNACVHIQQLLAYAVQHGFSGRRDFRGALIDLFRAGGWNFAAEVAAPQVPLVTADAVRHLLELHGGDDAGLSAALARMLGVCPPSEVAIWKDPQVMAQRLKLHSLQFKTGWARSSTKWAPAVNDYVLVFQKPGECENPVRPLYHARNPRGWLTQEDWILWARGVWDIDPMDILDGARSKRAMRALCEAEHEKHVCCLQREVIRRCVLLYSNPADVQPGVTVLDPFGGVGSTAVTCVELGRNSVSFELKESYYRASLDYIERARKGVATQTKQADLFSGTEEGAA